MENKVKWLVNHCYVSQENSPFLKPPIAEHKATVPTNRPNEFTKSFLNGSNTLGLLVAIIERG